MEKLLQNIREMEFPTLRQMKVDSKISKLLK